MNAAARHSWTDIRDRVHARILDRSYRPGDKLPRDADLADEFGCARSTVHRAMRALADSGIVERRRRGGTTVRADPVFRATLDIPITRIEIESRGDAYSYHLISRQRLHSTPAIDAAFGLARSQAMLHVCALHLANGRPYVFEDRWISLRTVPEIEAVDLARQSANEWLVRNRPFNRCDVRIHAQASDRSDSARMKMPVGSAVLILERTTWINGSPITNVRAVTAPGYCLSAAN